MSSAGLIYKYFGWEVLTNVLIKLIEQNNFKIKIIIDEKLID